MKKRAVRHTENFAMMSSSRRKCSVSDLREHDTCPCAFRYLHWSPQVVGCFGASSKLGVSVARGEKGQVGQRGRGCTTLIEHPSRVLSLGRYLQSVAVSSNKPHFMSLAPNNFPMLFRGRFGVVTRSGEARRLNIGLPLKKSAFWRRERCQWVIWKQALFRKSPYTQYCQLGDGNPFESIWLLQGQLNVSSEHFTTHQYSLMLSFQELSYARLAHHLQISVGVEEV